MNVADMLWQGLNLGVLALIIVVVYRILSRTKK